MSAHDVAPQTPEGFLPLIGAEIGFSDLTGPYFARRVDGVPILGFRVEAKHSNPSGVCHGGALAAFADYLAVITRDLAGVQEHTTPTVTLSIDFMKPVSLGSWVELHGRLLRRTKTLLFGDGVMIVDGNIAVRVNGIFIIGRQSSEFGFSQPSGDRISGV